METMIYTIVGEPFKQWVEMKVNLRHASRRQEEEQIQMDPEIAAVFNQS